MAETQKIKTNREQIVELLGRLHPEQDLNDEEVLFGLIYDDYDDYARVLTNREADLKQAEEQGELRGRNAQIETLMQPPAEGDGIPSLGGTNTCYRSSARSIFDIARG